MNENFSDNSDYDFLVSFKPISLELYPDNYFNLKFAMFDLLNREIDLLEKQAFNNPYLIKAIDKSKVLIYGLTN